MAAESVTRLQWLKADAAVTGENPPKAEAKEWHGSQDAAGVGAERQPVAEGESPPLVAE
jgi:hypothetical protein